MSDGLVHLVWKDGVSRHAVSSSDRAELNRLVSYGWRIDEPAPAPKSEKKSDSKGEAEMGGDENGWD